MPDGRGQKASPLVTRPVSSREAWRLCERWDAEYDALVERSTGARKDGDGG